VMLARIRSLTRTMMSPISLYSPMLVIMGPIGTATRTGNGGAALGRAENGNSACLGRLMRQNQSFRTESESHFRRGKFRLFRPKLTAIHTTACCSARETRTQSLSMPLTGWWQRDPEPRRLEINFYRQRGSTEVQSLLLEILQSNQPHYQQTESWVPCAQSRTAYVPLDASDSVPKYKLWSGTKRRNAPEATLLFTGGGVVRAYT